MQVYKYHSANIQPVSGVYEPDQDVKLSDTVDYSRDGIDFVFITALSGLQGVTTNNHTNLYLTNKNKFNNIVSSKTPKSEYPQILSTYLKVKDVDRYWVTNSTGVIELSGTEDLKDNRYFYEIEILDPTYAAIRHFNGTTLKYLTLTQSTSSRLTFETRSEDVSGNEWDSQIFKYILDGTNNNISLFSPVASGSSTTNRVNVQPSVIQSSYTSVYHLSAGPITKTWASNANQVFSIRPVTLAPTALALGTTWNSYVSAIEENTLKVNTDKSIQDIDNNFIIHAATNSLSSDMKVNLFPLKNQITPEGSQSRNNPYRSNETDVDHRDYHGLHTGTYEEHGSDNICLTYNTGIANLNLPTNKLTYFNLPSTMTPYKQLDVNDARLAEAGAIWSDSPITSDKIFKKLVNRNNDYVADVQDGSLLCSWLSGNSDPSCNPVWVDRYYNPTYVTYTAALTSGVIRSTSFETKFTTVTKKLSAESQYVYDKLSDLILEPNALYAYYHIGNRDSEKIVQSLSDDIVIENIDDYRDSSHVSMTPTYESVSYTTHSMPGGNDMSQSFHNHNSTTLQPTYTFESSNYGRTDTININGSFTLSFWMYNSDWSKPFADQFLGTYTTNGFGIFNEPCVTPFITTIDGDKIHLYNSDFKYLTTHYTGLTVKCFTKRGSTENYWFVDNNNSIYEYDMTGVIQNKITSSLLTGKTVVDIEVSDSYIYLALDDTDSYFRWDLNNQLAAYTGEMVASNFWNKGVTSIIHATSGLRVHYVSKGLSASNGVVLTTPDIHLAQGSTVDNLGNPWVIQNNLLYTYDTSISANIVGLSATGSQALECITCDKAGDLWLLYGSNKVAKFDTNRNSIFNISLSGTPLSSARYIDFVYEHTPAGYTGHAVILNQSLSGAKAINVDLDGNVKSEVSILTGALVTGDEIVKHFNTPLSSANTNFHSWKTITGFDNLRKNSLNTKPRIDAKVSLTNLYNSSTTTAAYSAYTLSYDLSAMKRGWHHFAVMLDAEKGSYNMFIDGVKVGYQSLPSSKFSYSNIFTQPITIGASPFYNNMLLSEAISQPKHYFAKNIKIQDVKLYSCPLSYFDLRAHFLQRSTIHDVNWQTPTGQRNYVETIERVFKHRLPGRRSEMYNVIISGLSATDSDMKKEIVAMVKEELDAIAPVYAKLNNVSWDNSLQAVPTTTQTVTSYNVVSGAVTTSSTQRTTNTTSYGS